MIAAMSENGVIGNNNALPWRLPQELKHFRKVTLGKPIIMGRKTFESLGSKPLPGRQNIILSRDPHFLAADCCVVNSVNQAIAAASPGEEMVVIGGAKIYQLFLPKVSRIYLTVVHQHCMGDTYFPKLNWDQWIKIDEQVGQEFTTQLWETAPIP